VGIKKRGTSSYNKQPGDGKKNRQRQILKKAAGGRNLGKLTERQSCSGISCEIAQGRKNSSSSSDAGLTSVTLTL
jgi:hypothetical protein